MEAKIEEALRRQRWEADKLRKDQEQLEREAEERKRRESAMMTALFMKAREESPFETRKRLRRESAQIIQKRARRFVRIVVQHRNKHACKIPCGIRPLVWGVPAKLQTSRRGHRRLGRVGRDGEDGHVPRRGRLLPVSSVARGL